MIHVPKSVTDEILAVLQGYTPTIDLATPCPSCGKPPLPSPILTHLFAIGCRKVRCASCRTDMPLATDIDDVPLPIFSTSPLDALVSIGGAKTCPGFLVDLGGAAGLNAGSENVGVVFEDREWPDSCPPIRLANGFYDGADRRSRFGKEFLPLRHHFDVLCNLKALEISVSSGQPVPRKATIQCFRRTKILLGCVWLSPLREKVAAQLTKNWQVVVLTMAYFRRVLAEADRVLACTAHLPLSEAELEAALSRSDIHLAHCHAVLMEGLAEFFTARFFAARNLICGSNFRGGYEARQILDCIEEPMKSLTAGDSTPSFFWDYMAPSAKQLPEHLRAHYGVANDTAWSDARRELRNAVATYIRYHYTKGMAGNVKVDDDDYHAAPIGKDLSHCFIATAACGTADSHLVTTLQAFRDDVLARSWIGRIFITAYERCSPPLAQFIARWEPLRRTVRAIVVVPAARLAKRAVDRRRITETEVHAMTGDKGSTRTVNLSGMTVEVKVSDLRKGYRAQAKEALDKITRTSGT